MSEFPRVSTHVVVVDIIFALSVCGIVVAAAFVSARSSLDSRDTFVLVGCAYILTAINEIYRYDTLCEPNIFNRSHTVHFCLQVLPSVLLFIEAHEAVIVLSLICLCGLLALVRLVLLGLDYYRSFGYQVQL